MASKDPVSYEIDANVGWGMPNNRPDVMLVQFFLKEIMNHPDSRAGRPPGNDMVVDGLFGNQTETWIRAYQKFAKSKGLRIAIDGKVHVAPSDYSARMTGGTGYTILHLNATHRRRWRIDHDYLDNCARVPGELRATLREPW
jgi:hypothetical protein